MALSFFGGLWVAVARAYNVINGRTIEFEKTIGEHSRLPAEHAVRMEKHDARLLSVTGDLRELIGSIKAAR